MAAPPRDRAGRARRRGRRPGRISDRRGHRRRGCGRRRSPVAVVPMSPSIGGTLAVGDVSSMLNLHGLRQLSGREVYQVWVATEPACGRPPTSFPTARASHDGGRRPPRRGDEGDGHKGAASGPDEPDAARSAHRDGSVIGGAGPAPQLPWRGHEASTRTRQTCYRHPNRETGVSCSNCGRPICPECMTSTSVGMRCPECAGQRTKVRRQGRLPLDRPERARRPIALIAINVLVFLGRTAGGGAGADHGAAPAASSATDAVFGPAINNGGGLPDRHRRLPSRRPPSPAAEHVSFSGSWGSCSSRRSGRRASSRIYFVSLLAGSFGALVADPDLLTVGASGRDLRADGSGDRDRAATRSARDRIPDRRLLVAEPGPLVLDQRDLGRRAHRRPDRRRGRGAPGDLRGEADGGRPGFALELAGIVLMIAATFAGALCGRGLAGSN